MLAAGVLALAGGAGSGALHCLSDVVDAADHDEELRIPEAELTMVHIQSWEQKLDWRSFLGEAVASSKARQLFVAFDVEAEPPSYAKPPLSSRPEPGSHDQQALVRPGGLLASALSAPRPL